jgi:fucose permease
MEFLLFVGYAALCLLVGTLGRTTRIGYWGTVLVSFVVTPIAAFLFLFFFAPRPAARR